MDDFDIKLLFELHAIGKSYSFFGKLVSFSIFYIKITRPKLKEQKKLLK